MKDKKPNPKPAYGGRPKSKRRGKVIAVYISPESNSALRAHAESEGLSISSVVDTALKPLVDRAVREYEKDMKRKKADEIDAKLSGEAK